MVKTMQANPLFLFDQPIATNHAKSGEQEFGQVKKY